MSFKAWFTQECTEIVKETKTQMKETNEVLLQQMKEIITNQIRSSVSSHLESQITSASTSSFSSSSSSSSSSSVESAIQQLQTQLHSLSQLVHSIEIAKKIDEKDKENLRKLYQHKAKCYLSMARAYGSAFLPETQGYTEEESCEVSDEMFGNFLSDSCTNSDENVVVKIPNLSSKKISIEKATKEREEEDSEKDAKAIEKKHTNTSQKGRKRKTVSSIVTNSQKRSKKTKK
jgi:hypothetical protein